MDDYYIRLCAVNSAGMGQTLTCADGESIYSSIFSTANISVRDTTTVPRLRRANQESRAVDLRVLSEEKFRSSRLVKLGKLRIADRCNQSA